MKSPAFQFYPTDYIGSQRVRLMSLEEEGAYINLLCSCWQHGSIPSDPQLAARIIGKGCTTTVATTVLTMFTPSTEQGRMIHERLEQERGKQEAWRNKSAAGGRKSAEIRKGGSRVVQQDHQPNGNTLSSSSSSSSNNRTDHSVIEAVWSAYPLKVGKKKACTIIASLIKKGRNDLEEKVKAYAAAVATWPAGEEQYIPHPATWFSRGSYDDDPTTWQRKASKPTVIKPDRINFKTDDYSGIST